jgi:transposase
LREHLVEPNSSLGKAFQYLLNQWETLTQFLRVAGAPFDNNTVERALKLMIRQRRNSLFYASTHSAYVASLLTSVIATCAEAGINALAYLVALQEHRPRSSATPPPGCPGTIPNNWRRFRRPGASPRSHMGGLGMAVPEQNV